MELILTKFQKQPKPIEAFIRWAEDEEEKGVEDADVCSNCRTTDCFDKSDLLICKACGEVVSRPFDTTAEYRFFSNDDRGGDPTRVGAPQNPCLPQASLGTVILGQGKAKIMYKVRKYHTWNTVPYKERSLMQADERLKLIGLNHGFNQSIIESSLQMYVTIKEIGGRQGLSRDAMLAGCMYLVLKESGSPRKPKDIAEMFGLSSATFTKALKQLQEILAMARQKGLLSKTKAKTSSCSTKATEYIALPLSKLPLQRAQQEHLMILCNRVAEQVEKLGLGQENMPPSLAAGCVAFVLKRCEVLDISLSQIAEVSQISIATLQKCLRRLELHAAALERFF
jgi:transcription initiation factor TFIIIB Brf1 subunit/transcription initiation factor TFIIB